MLLAIDVLAAIGLPVVLQVFRVLVIARVDAHHDAALAHAFLIELRALFWNPCADESANESARQSAFACAEQPGGEWACHQKAQTWKRNGRADSRDGR